MLEVADLVRRPGAAACARPGLDARSAPGPAGYSSLPDAGLGGPRVPQPPRSQVSPGADRSVAGPAAGPPAPLRLLPAHRSPAGRLARRQGNGEPEGGAGEPYH